MNSKCGLLGLHKQIGAFPSKVLVSVAITAQSRSNPDRGYIMTKVGFIRNVRRTLHIQSLVHLGKNRNVRAPVNYLVALTCFERLLQLSKLLQVCDDLFFHGVKSFGHIRVELCKSL
jgi:hypothetical protein